MFQKPKSAGRARFVRGAFQTAAAALIGGALGASAWAQSAPAAPVFRISTENTASHFQTRVVQRFVDELTRRTRGRLTVEFRHSAQLFRDQDVVRALSEGKVDMAVPGTWQLDRFDPYVSVLMLPMFLGRDSADHHRIRDGKIGQLVSAHLSESINVVVPGRWIDLGPAHVYSLRKSIQDHSDMAGLRIRIAGGTAIAAQLAAVGALPQLVPWPDLPDVLQQGRLDGLLSTHETVASARLWEQGIRHAVEIRAYFAQYIPMVSRRRWDSLPPDLREAVRQSWESIVDGARLEAMNAQRDARRSLEEHGVRVVEPTRAALLEWRKLASAEQPALARKLGVPEELVNEARKQLVQDP